MVFAVKPAATKMKRFSRLWIAILVGYGLLILGVNLHESRADIVMAEFYRAFPECIDHACPNTPHPYIKGATWGVLISLGWVIVALYVGLWEIVWRLYHRRTINAMGEAFETIWFGQVLTGLAIFAFVIFPLCVWVAVSVLEMMKY